MFIPTTQKELDKLGWDSLDVILVTGDSYVDSPYIGVSVIGKTLIKAGYRVGIIAQPDLNSVRDIGRLGEPTLFWGVTGGNIDSMVANYTATKRPKRTDDLTPGGRNDRRPDRGSIVYTNLIKRHFKNHKPIVLGGVEASLRRVAHYDFWSNKIRRALLFDAKADYLLYGMADKSVLELASALKSGQPVEDIRGICYIAKEKKDGTIEIPSYESVVADKHAFIDMFHTFYKNNDPVSAKGLSQKHGTRYLIQNPPAYYLTEDALDAVYELDFERAQHPFYAKFGDVRALDTIKFSVTTHRGCYGECNFCAIAVHQGRTIRSRSEDSIVRDVQNLTTHPDFKGIIQDVGGPTANMYGFECDKKLDHGICVKKDCISPKLCPLMPLNHNRQIQLLRRLRKIKGIRKIFVASGIRYDMVLDDKKYGEKYLDEIVKHHVSGQLKIAPEHTEDHILKRMRKPGKQVLVDFRTLFQKLNKAAKKKQFLSYYFIAAHPGSTEGDMRAAKKFTNRELRVSPEQTQIFTPTPSTYSTLMYYTEMDPFTRKKIFVEKDPVKKDRQKKILIKR